MSTTLQELKDLRDELDKKIKQAERTLPDKPSQLLRRALRDLETVEKSPHYRIQMDNWHRPAYGGVCEVCLAGSVIANSLEWDRKERVIPNMSDPEPLDEFLTKKIYAIDSFRCGDIREALQRLGGDYDRWADIEVHDYHDNPDLFKRDMRNIARLLEANGQ